MLILAIESSCDDTSVALVNCSPDGHVIISEKTASQIEIHKKYGGVVPEIAGRMHAEKIVPLIEEVLSEGNKEMRKQRNSDVDIKLLLPDVIAVTAGPGLITGLLVGVAAARTFSYATGIPLVRVNHIEGHIHSVEISNDKFLISSKSPNSQNNNIAIEQSNQPTMNKFSPEADQPLTKKNRQIVFPALALVVSGGHTELILMKGRGVYEKLGATKDDAAGECFDKVAKLLDLPYPGGPQISNLAEKGNTKAIQFPRPMLDQGNYDFSFAGLKTSALYWLRDNTPLAPLDTGAKITINDFCASFEQAIVDVLITKTIRAAKQYKPKTIILAGGVAANKKLRQTLGETISQQLPDSLFLIPDSQYCMDNAAMIAVAGYYHALKNEFVDWKDIKADPNWRIA